LRLPIGQRIWYGYRIPILLVLIAGKLFHLAFGILRRRYLFITCVTVTDCSLFIGYGIFVGPI